MPFELYAEENAPIVKQAWTTYKLTVPKPSEMKTNEVPFVYVDVEPDGLMWLDERLTVWFGTHFDVQMYGSVHAMRQEIYEWLIEWELAIWLQVGPEDRELFATKKLTGEDYEYEML